MTPRSEVRKELPQQLLEILEATPLKSLDSVIVGLGHAMGARKTSKLLASHWLLDTIAISEPRLLVLTSALYLEYIAERSLRNQGLQRKRGSLAGEIQALGNTGRINHDLRDDVLAIVKLRNEYVHNLFFDISDWDPLTAPFLTGTSIRIPKGRSFRRAKNLMLLKILMISILFRFDEAFPWLVFEDVPMNYRRRQR